MKQKVKKPIPFKIQKSENHALFVQLEGGGYFYDKLHYHPEFQITAIEQGKGVFYAGNSMTSFEPGTVLVIGSGVPHLLKQPDIFYSEASPGIKGVSLFFDHYSFGEKFFELAELAGVKSLLQLANRGFKIAGPLKAEIFQQILRIPHQEQEALVIAFLQTLSLIRKAEQVFVNDAQYYPQLDEVEGSRLNAVLDYTFQHFRSEIKLEDIAQVAHLSRSQFSKFFKQHTDKTYVQFLNELRIEQACALLLQTNHTIEQLCYEVGFKNVSNFVRQFKRYKKTTPSSYRKSWQNS